MTRTRIDPVQAGVPTGGSTAQVLTKNSSTDYDASWETPSAGSSGTVTSVALSLPAELTVSGSPVTASGTLAAVWANETTNKVFAAPNGSTGTPAFRALVAADIPAIAESGVTNLTTDLAAKLAAASNLSDLGSAATARGNLGVAIGSNVEAWSAVLDALASVMSSTATATAQRTALGLGTAATHPVGDFAQTANNLSDLASASTARTNLGVAVQSISIALNNGTSALAVGQYVDTVVEYACTLTAATLLADQSGSVVIDLRKCTYAQFDDSTHPVSGDSICASTKPTISSAVKSQDTSLTSWTTSLSAGDILRAYVVSATTLTQVTLSLKITRA